MNRSSNTDLPAAVPLVELLRAIPRAQRLVWVETDGLKASHHVPIGNYAHEAADEIGRLQAEIKRITGDREPPHCQSCSCGLPIETAASKAEVLRDALRLIAAGPPWHLPNDEVASWAGWIASQALSGLALEKEELRIVGWAVHSREVENGAFYNLADREQAEDAARRWGSMLTALVAHPSAPAASSPSETEGSLK